MIKCPLCKKILVKEMNIEEYEKLYPNEKYMWCCYCRRVFPISIELKGGIKKDG